MTRCPAVLLAVVLLCPPPAAAAGAEPPVIRIWAGTRIDVGSTPFRDEAGTEWLDVRGRLVSDRGEPVAGADLRFERPGAAEHARTGAEGSFRVRLRAEPGGGRWTIRFDGTERLRPSRALVPRGDPGAGGSWWLVLAPLGVLAAAAALALAGRAAARSAARLLALLRRVAAGARRAPRASRSAAAVRAPPRTVAVLDALRRRPLDGVRLETPEPEARVVAVGAADGLVTVPPGCGPLRLTRHGYLPAALPPVPPAAAATGPQDAERIGLLRGRDAVVALLEAVRVAAGPPPVDHQQTVLEMAVRVLPEAEAWRVVRICYGAPAPVGEVERRLLADLQARAGVPVPEAGARAAVAGTEAAIAAALSDEVSAGS